MKIQMQGPAAAAELAGEGDGLPAAQSSRLRRRSRRTRPSIPLKDRALWIGGTVVCGGLLVFILWGSLAPLAQGVVATGVVEVAGENKVVQHLEGGIVKEMFVREGDRVAAGDMLLVLEDTKPRAEQGRAGGALLRRPGRDRSFERGAFRPRGNPALPGGSSLCGGDYRIEEIIQAETDLFVERRASTPARSRS